MTHINLKLFLLKTSPDPSYNEVNLPKGIIIYNNLDLNKIKKVARYIPYLVQHIED